MRIFPESLDKNVNIVYNNIKMQDTGGISIMWTSSLLKQNAKNSMKPYYWTAFGLLIIMAIISGAASYAVSFFAMMFLGIAVGTSDLEEIANKLNKRFTFDESALIHLIEASKSSNIQLEEWFQRRSPKNKRQILRQRDDGTYYLADVTDAKNTDTYTTGKSIPTMDIIKDNGKTITKTISDDSSNINILSYPGAKELIGTASADEIMKEVMKNLFDNLELCVNTYKFFYTKLCSTL